VANASTNFTINKGSRTISFDSSTLSIVLGKQKTISATVSAGADDGTITYSSSDSTVASINGDVVSGVSTGSCTITATISQGDNYLSASTSYTLNVSESIVVTCVYHVEEGGGSGSGSGSGGDVTIKLLNNTSGITSMTVNGDDVVLSETYTATTPGDYKVDFYLSENKINDYTFSNCYKLISCKIDNGVTSIGEDAFQGCNSLTSCAIGSGVTSIGSSAFYGCNSLTSIDIPDSVTSIGNYAFYYCRNLTNITCNATTAPTIKSDTFQDVKTSGTLYVPIGSSGYDVWMGIGNYYLGKYSWTKVEQ
jgi:hypothetical protein